jgi:hypothetical protein
MAGEYKIIITDSKIELFITENGKRRNGEWRGVGGRGEGGKRRVGEGGEGGEGARGGRANGSGKERCPSIKYLDFDLISLNEHSAALYGKSLSFLKLSRKMDPPPKITLLKNSPRDRAKN